MRSVCRLTISLLAVYFFSSKAAICSSSLLAALVAILLEPIFISAVYFLSRILEHSLGHYIFLDIFYRIQSATITVFISVTAENSTNWCQKWDHRMATRAASRLEEQMAALLEKMDRQSERLEDLVKWQTERVDGLARKQVETEEHVSAVEGDLNSVKAAVDGRLSAVELRIPPDWPENGTTRGIAGETRAAEVGTSS